MDSHNHLRLVPFNPNDYSLGEALVRDSQEEVTDPRVLSAALSLYFQWPEGSHAVVSLGDQRSCEIAFDYDREERVASEFKILFGDLNDFEVVKSHNEFLVRFEVFRQCFEFSCVHSIVNPDLDGDPSWHIIVPAPSSLLVYKQRRLPRIALTDFDRGAIGPVEILYSSDGMAVPVDLVEMGMRSLRVKGVDSHLGDPTHLRMKDQTYPVKVLRKEGESVVFDFVLTTSEQVGQVFDVYRIVAFPHLRPRHHFSNEQVVELYAETNYLGKFTSDEAYGERIAALKQVWNEVHKVQHTVSADYVTVGDNGELVGASSCSHAFRHKRHDLWVFHQLCAKASPSLLVQSGELYTWRAEYLAGRVEDLTAGVWFDSKSRWLERIYVKFAFHKSKQVQLLPVSIFRRVISGSLTKDSVETRQLPVGTLIRSMVDTEMTFGAAGPSFYNAANILDSIVCIENAESGVIGDFSGAICKGIGREQLTFELTIPASKMSEFEVQEKDFKVTDCDRFCLFDKASLVDFISSVEHSVAVTKKKKSISYGSEAS